MHVSIINVTYTCICMHIYIYILIPLSTYVERLLAVTVFFVIVGIPLLFPPPPGKRPLFGVQLSKMKSL